MAMVLQSKEQLQAPVQAPHRWRFTPEQYLRMGEMGFFTDHHVELIGGDIYMAPTGPEHETTVDELNYRFIDLLRGKGRYVRVQNSLQIGDNLPEPDIAVVSGKPSDYRKQRPTTALLVIEVSDITLPFDRTHKASLYASANIPEYWIVNLNDGLLEVYREPTPMENTPFGAGYKQVRRYTQEETVIPLFDPEVSIPVRSLLEGDE